MDLGSGKVGKDTGERFQGLWVGGNDSVMVVSFACGTRSTVFGCMGEDPVNVGCDFFSVVRIYGVVGGRWVWRAIRVIFEEFWEFGLDSLFCRQFRWAL